MKPEAAERFQNWFSNFERDDEKLHVTPAQMRWLPMKMPEAEKMVNFFEGITTYCGAGTPSLKVKV